MARFDIIWNRIADIVTAWKAWILWTVNTKLTLNAPCNYVALWLHQCYIYLLHQPGGMIEIPWRRPIWKSLRNSNHLIGFRLHWTWDGTESSEALCYYASLCWIVCHVLQPNVSLPSVAPLAISDSLYGSMCSWIWQYHVSVWGFTVLIVSNLSQGSKEWKTPLHYIERLSVGMGNTFLFAHQRHSERLWRGSAPELAKRAKVCSTFWEIPECI